MSAESLDVSVGARLWWQGSAWTVVEHESAIVILRSGEQFKKVHAPSLVGVAQALDDRDMAVFDSVNREFDRRDQNDSTPDDHEEDDDVPRPQEPVHQLPTPPQDTGTFDAFTDPNGPIYFLAMTIPLQRLVNNGYLTAKQLNNILLKVQSL